MGGRSSAAQVTVERVPIRRAEPAGTVRAASRERELERAMRAHPAGRALAPRSPVRQVVPDVRPRLRLTARGRLLLTVLGLALAVGIVALAGGTFGDAPAGRLHLTGESRVVVHPGDTLWSIARSVAGDGDVRTVVARIEEVNGLHGAALRPGQVLRLP